MTLLSSMWPAMLARVTDVTRTPLSGIVWRSSTNTSFYRYNVPRRYEVERDQRVAEVVDHSVHSSGTFTLSTRTNWHDPTY